MKFSTFFKICLGMTLWFALVNNAVAEEQISPNTGDSSFCDLETWKQTCEVGCPDGYAHDENGCPICECFSPLLEHEDSVCGRSPICRVHCKEYAKDQYGCATCECAEENVSDLSFVAEREEIEATCNISLFKESCTLGCPSGYAHDSRGCPVCECFVSPSDFLSRCGSPVTCATKCKNFKSDDEGCPTCQCSEEDLLVLRSTSISQPSPRELNEISCDFSTFKETCSIGCPNGYSHDENGCPVCQCFEKPGEDRNRCETMVCDRRCENYRIDDHGCPTCECN